MRLYFFCPTFFCLAPETMINAKFAARFAASYNQSFPNDDGKSATIDCEITL